MNTKKMIADVALTSLFALLLCCVLLGSVFSWDFYGVQDNRVLAAKPDLDSASLDELPTQLETYFNDHFGFRNTLVRRYNKLMERHFGQADPTVTIGKDGWLFATTTIHNYLGYEEVTEDYLEGWRLILEGRRAWLAERGIPYLFVVAPSKITIYPEKLPEHLSRVDAVTRLDKLMAYLNEHSDVPVLDLRPALLEEKRYRQVYYALDTHWNHYGLLVAYKQVITALQELIPGMRDPTDFDESFFVPGVHKGDLARMTWRDEDEYGEACFFFQSDQLYSWSGEMIEGAWLEELYKRADDPRRRCSQRSENPDNRLEAILFHDSFMKDMARFLARDFRVTHLASS